MLKNLTSENTNMPNARSIITGKSHVSEFLFISVAILINEMITIINTITIHNLTILIKLIPDL